MRNIDIWLTLFDLNNEKFRENFYKQKWQTLHPLHMGVIEVLDNKLTDNEQNR